MKNLEAFKTDNNTEEYQGHRNLISMNFLQFGNLSY